MLANVFQFDRISNASETMREISRRALKMIGAESRINARRVSRFGVKIEPADAPPVARLTGQGDGSPRLFNVRRLDSAAKSRCAPVVPLTTVRQSTPL
jgi:hypothetical protein